jgi:hypothetical protein
MQLRSVGMVGLMIPLLMISSGCRITTTIDSACIVWLKEYPKQTDQQLAGIHAIDPRMSTWARDYKTEYKHNCTE